MLTSCCSCVAFHAPHYHHSRALLCPQIGANLLKEGINLTKISLPVCLFEPRSFLERATSSWDFMDLLIRAAESQDPAERMKYVIGFAVAGLSRQVSFHKPFNPILGACGTVVQAPCPAERWNREQGKIHTAPMTPALPPAR